MQEEVNEKIITLSVQGARITASMVKDLREKTGAGMMDCKKALVATDGDFSRLGNGIYVMNGKKYQK